MADVTVNIVMNPGWEKQIFMLPQVKGAVTKEANAVASRANALGAGYRTGYYHPNHKSPAVGGTQPKYKAFQAQVFNKTPVAIVVTKNYAAMKDNMLHNTLLKSL